MSDQPDLVLLRLREIRDLLGEVRADTADTRLRVGMLEAGYASVSVRLDRLAGDIERIKRLSSREGFPWRKTLSGHTGHAAAW